LGSRSFFRMGKPPTACFADAGAKTQSQCVFERQ